MLTFSHISFQSIFLSLSWCCNLVVTVLTCINVESCLFLWHPNAGIVPWHYHHLAFLSTTVLSFFCSLAKNFLWLHHCLQDQILQNLVLIYIFPFVPCHSIPKYVTYTTVTSDHLSFPNYIVTSICLCPCWFFCQEEPSRVCCLMKSPITFCPIIVVQP